jgi:hypothetical protein
MCKSIKRLIMIATVLGAAVLPSIAAARPDGPDRPYSDASAAVQAIAPPEAQAVSTPSTDGFSWHDAAFGAGGMLVLIAVGSGAVLAVRRGAILS